ncbi:MAG: holo-ACP synthase [Pseudomonadota bacterium]
MIHGIGTDIVSVQRMDELHARYAGRLAQHILAPEELTEFARSAQPQTFLAKRFAAKEAFAKAVGTGMRTPVHFTAIRVVHDALGRPGLAFSDRLADWLREKGLGQAHLSISDEHHYAVAFVILERAP